MDWKLEVLVIPVGDVDRAKEFYAGRLGFAVDTDFAPNEHFRVVQVTPPGSACSIVFGTGLPTGAPLKGSQFVVADIAAAADQPRTATRGRSSRASGDGVSNQDLIRSGQCDSLCACRRRRISSACCARPPCG